MFANNIPMECQKWHLNRLIALIRVCEEFNRPPTKMDKRQTAAYYAEENARRRKQYNSRGQHIMKCIICGREFDPVTENGKVDDDICGLCEEARDELTNNKGED